MCEQQERLQLIKQVCRKISAEKEILAEIEQSEEQELNFNED